MTYTKGPWHVVPYGDGDQKVICSDEAGDWRIAFMATTSGSREELAEIEANARLISAAPCLYEALESVPMPNGSTSWNEWKMAFLEWHEKAARSALLKAKGEA